MQSVAGALAYCAAAGFLLTLIDLLIPVFSQVFVDEILVQGRMDWLRPLLLAMAITAVFQGALTLLQLPYLRRLQIKLSLATSGGFLWHILRLPIGFYAQRFAGEISDRTRLNNQVADWMSEWGGNLSGGQRHRLLIAKALVLKPRILLFDEATSALDNCTQAIVSENLDQLQVTRIVIAHRLSTIRNADRIYVLQTGRVVQQGSFDELAAQEGLFSNLMKRQTA